MFVRNGAGNGLARKIRRCPEHIGNTALVNGTRVDYNKKEFLLRKTGRPEAIAEALHDLIDVKLLYVSDKSGLDK